MKKQHHLRSTRRLTGGLAASFAGLAILASPASAASVSWTGGTDTAWATGTNWIGNSAPTNDLTTDIAVFSQTSYPNQPNAGTTSIAGLQIGDGTTSTAALTLSGTALTIGGSGISMFSNAGAATISSPITLGAAQTWSNTSNSLTISGTVANGGFLLTSGGIGNTTISGLISGTGGLSKTGSGTLTLSTATNTFSGGLTISGGTLSYDNNLRLGGTSGTAGAVAINGGTLKTTNVAALTNTHAITIGSNGGTIYVAGAAQTGQNSRIILNANTLLGSGALTITGNGFVDQAGGSGTVVLNGANNGAGGYSGNITLQNGGMLTYEAANGLASAATVTLNNNTEFAVANAAGTASNNITVNGGTNSNLSFINGNAGVFSGVITLNANATVGLRDWYNNATVRSGTISGAITGTGGLTVNSGYGTGGTLTLSGVNTYTGNTIVTGSTLTLNGNTGSLVSNANIKLNAGTFNYQGATTGSTLDASGYTFSGSDRTYQVTYGTSGNTALTLADANRAAGSTNNYVVSGGANGTTNKITFNSAPTTGVLVDKGNYFGGTSYLAYDVGGYARAYSYSTDANGATSTGGATLGSVTGLNVDLTTAAVTAQTTDSINTLRLGTTNGVTMTTGNTLSVDGILKSGGNAATITGGNITTATGGGEMVIRSNATTDTLTISSVIADNGTSSLTKSGPGTLALNAANTYAGGTNIGGGIVTFNNNASFGTGTITSNGGGTIRSAGGVTTTNNLVVNGLTILDATNAGNWNMNGNISGAGDIVRGTNANISLYLGGNNSGYTGTFTVQNNGNAVVRFNNVNSGSASAKWVFNNSTASKTTLSWAGTGTISFGSISGSGVLQTDIAGAKTISVGALGLNDNFSGTINNGTGTIALTKVGSGTLTLYGSNGYTGATTINAGTLALGAANRIADTSPMVLNGGTFATGGFSETLGTLTLSSSSSISFSGGSSLLAYADSSALIWTGTLTLANFDVGTDYLKFGTSNSALTGSQLAAISVSGYTVTGLDVNGYVTFTAVPEPHEFALAVIGLLGVLIAIRRRRMHGYQ